MRYKYFNPNPRGATTGDCVIRAICKATGESWDDVYTGLSFQGFAMKDMPSANHVWGEYLRSKGFVRRAIPNTCPNCVTVEEFAIENNRGTFILGTGTHVVTVVDGIVYDSWNSLEEVPIFYYRKRGL